MSKNNCVQLWKKVILGPSDALLITSISTNMGCGGMIGIPPALTKGLCLSPGYEKN